MAGNAGSDIAVGKRRVFSHADIQAGRRPVIFKFRGRFDPGAGFPDFRSLTIRRGQQK